MTGGWDEDEATPAKALIPPLASRFWRRCLCCSVSPPLGRSAERASRLGRTGGVTTGGIDGR